MSSNFTKNINNKVKQVNQKYVDSMITTSIKNNSLSDTKFYFIHVNALSIDEVTSIQLLELAVAEFSLGKGLEKGHHDIINLNDDNENDVLDDVDGQTNIFDAYQKLSSFFENNAQSESPILFTSATSNRMVALLLNKMIENREEQTKEFYIYSLEELFKMLRNAVAREFNEPDVSISYVHKLLMNADKLTFHGQCIIHGSLSNHQHLCSKSILVKWAFIIYHDCWKYLKISKVPICFEQAWSEYNKKINKNQILQIGCNEQGRKEEEVFKGPVQDSRINSTPEKRNVEVPTTLANQIIIPHVSDDNIVFNSVGFLQALCAKNDLPQPTYTFLNNSTSNLPHRCQCQILNHIATGESVLKKQAKQAAAKNMVYDLFTYISDLKKPKGVFIETKNQLNKDKTTKNDTDKKKNTTDKKKNTTDKKKNGCNPIMQNLLCELKLPTWNNLEKTVHTEVVDALIDLINHCGPMTHSKSKEVILSIFEKILSMLQLNVQEKLFIYIENNVHLVLIKLSLNPSITEIGLGQSEDEAEIKTIAKLADKLLLSMKYN